MSYSQGGLIQTSDYNTLVGDASGVGSGTGLNLIIGTGSASEGYGQTPLAHVSSGLIYAAPWANLVNTISNIGSHQGSTLQSMTTPAVGGTITYQASVTNNLTTIYDNRLNAASQGSTANTTATGSSSWRRPSKI